MTKNQPLKAGYNRCLRCKRAIKEPQIYGRVCQRKIEQTTAKDGEISSDAPEGEVSHCYGETSVSS